LEIVQDLAHRWVAQLLRNGDPAVASASCCAAGSRINLVCEGSCVATWDIPVTASR
jgi:hypothetical protein